MARYTATRCIRSSGREFFAALVILFVNHMISACLSFSFFWGVGVKEEER
jgi:hypothetical protein